MAFDLARRYKADVLETDVRISSDGVPVLHHDAKLDRTTNGSGFVSDLSLKELKSLDAAYHFKNLTGEAYRDRGISILTLDEFLDEYQDIAMSIEIKHPDTDFAKKVATTVKQTGRSDNITLASFHAKIIHAVRQTTPEITTTTTRDETMDLYMSRRRFSRWMNNLHDRLFEANDKGNATTYPRTLQIPPSFKFGPFTIDLTTADFIDYLHQQNLSVNYWTINSAEKMVELSQNGADGLITDRIDIASKIFDL